MCWYMLCKTCCIGACTYNTTDYCTFRRLHWSMVNLKQFSDDSSSSEKFQVIASQTFDNGSWKPISWRTYKLTLSLYATVWLGTSTFFDVLSYSYNQRKRDTSLTIYVSVLSWNCSSKELQLHKLYSELVFICIFMRLDLCRVVNEL